MTRVRIPRDVIKRRELYEAAGLTDEERRAIDEWCAAEQRAYETRLRRALEDHADDPMAARIVRDHKPGGDDDT